MTNLIGISGRKNSGKDTVGKIIQYLDANKRAGYNHPPSERDMNDYFKGKHNTTSPWKIKKYADKLKDIVCILIGCTRADLEDEEFKSKPLGEEWDYWVEPNGLLKPILGTGMMFQLGSEARTMTPRLMLQLTGTEFGRNILGENTWVNASFVGYTKKFVFEKPYLEQLFPKWIFTDVRFPNEFKAIKDRGGISIRCGRDTGVTDNHPSEISLDDATFDYYIDCNGTVDELIPKVKSILILEDIL